MSEYTKNNRNLIAALSIAAAVAFLYATVVAKLGRDWWTDENYSHGLLVPFVIAMIVWREWDSFEKVVKRPVLWLGSGAVLLAALMLFAGTLGAELFTQRISLVLMLAGIVVYLFGTKLLNLLAVPFALLLLAIPIPQIVFNRIAIPLQMWASQMAVWGIRLFDVPTLRKGNVIDILPRGSTQTLSLEVVEACSGIRSLMTLFTLALILAYFTRRDGKRGLADFSTPDFIRAILLMASAIPIAVITNAARVAFTGIMTFYYGKQATDGTWHELSGWLVYIVALAFLFLTNYLLKLVIRGSKTVDDTAVSFSAPFYVTQARVCGLATAIFICGIGVNWFVNRGEMPVDRRPLTELSSTLGDWKQKGNEIKFDEQTESVLRTSDYTMREYSLPDGRMGNIYIGYYASQRSGATYHSPQNCLPGAGWIMRDPQFIDITTASGRTFQANRYILQNGPYNEVMIYWYQGRGRTEASEYNDKLNTILDSVIRRRSDGAMVRVMTTISGDEEDAIKAAINLSARLEEVLTPFIPE